MQAGGIQGLELTAWDLLRLMGLGTLMPESHPYTDLAIETSSLQHLPLPGDTGFRVQGLGV